MKAASNSRKELGSMKHWRLPPSQYRRLRVFIIASLFVMISYQQTKISNIKNKNDRVTFGNFSFSGSQQAKPINNTAKLLKRVDMDKSANNFTRFMTYGPPRTSSTVQFNMLCTCFFLHMKLHFPTLANETKCHFIGSDTNYNDLSLDQPQVIKTHNVNRLKDWGVENSGIFNTARTKEKGRQMADKLKKLGGKVGLTQDLETLSEIKATGFIELYAYFFDLPSRYLPMLREYFTLWEKLRVCCGLQMSKYWRYELNHSTWNQKLDPHPFCGSLDIDAVEKAFINTTIFKMIEDNSRVVVGIRRINRPALIDDALDGSYCSRYNEAVRTKGLKFNYKQRI